MKRAVETLLIAISILCAAAGVYAAETSGAPETKKLENAPGQGDWLRICATFGELAEKIMTDRQGGISRAKMIQSVHGDSLFEYIVVEAYEVPRYSTDKIRKRSAEEFRDKIYLECINATKLK